MLGETKVYGQVYVRLADGTVIESAVYSYTLRSLVEQVAANASGFSQAQLDALKTMLQKNPEATEDWNIDPLR